MLAAHINQIEGALSCWILDCVCRRDCATWRHLPFTWIKDVPARGSGDVLLVAFDFRRYSAYKQVNSRSATLGFNSDLCLLKLDCPTPGKQEDTNGRHSDSLQCFFEHNVIYEALILISDIILDGWCAIWDMNSLFKMVYKRSVLTGFSFSPSFFHILSYVTKAGSWFT